MADIEENVVEENSYNTVIEELKTEADNWRNMYLYALSDLDNYKKNSLKEKTNLIKYSTEKVIKDIIPIIDDFERVFEYSNGEVSDGIILIYNKFIKVLNKHNVKVINPEIGDDFSDSLHEAVSVVPSNGNENKIAKCIEKGYMIEDKVIRYAKVVVFN